MAGIELQLRLLYPAASSSTRLPPTISVKASELPLMLGRNPKVDTESRSRVVLTPCDTDLKLALSRCHASIVVSQAQPSERDHTLASGYSIIDHNSRNGVYVNHRRVVSSNEPVALLIGDTVTLGRVQRHQDCRRDGVTYVLERIDGPTVGAKRKRSEWSPAAAESALPERGNGGREGDGDANTAVQQQQKHLQEEEDTVVVKADQVVCGICLEVIAAACHLSCGHSHCFRCMHKFFFHRSLKEAANWGFSATYTCPTDRKPVAAVARDVRLDEICQTMAESSVKMTREEKLAWTQRKSDGMAIAKVYDGMGWLLSSMRWKTDKVALEVEYLMSTSSHTCRGCPAPIAPGANFLLIITSNFRVEGLGPDVPIGRGPGAGFHASCLRLCLLSAVSSRRQTHRFCTMRVTVKPGVGVEGAQAVEKMEKEMQRELGTGQTEWPWWLHECVVWAGGRGGMLPPMMDDDDTSDGEWLDVPGGRRFAGLLEPGSYRRFAVPPFRPQGFNLPFTFGLPRAPMAPIDYSDDDDLYTPEEEDEEEEDEEEEEEQDGGMEHGGMGEGGIAADGHDDHRQHVYSPRRDFGSMSGNHDDDDDSIEEDEYVEGGEGEHAYFPDDTEMDEDSEDVVGPHPYLPWF